MEKDRFVKLDTVQSGAHPMNDLRSVKRFDISIPAVIYGASDREERPVAEMITKNISSAGAYFVTEKPLPPGAEFKISLKMPNPWALETEKGGATVSLTGTVVRQEPGGVAVAFKNNFRFIPARA